MKYDTVGFLTIDVLIVLYQDCGMTYEEAEYTAYSELGINCY